MPWGKQSVSLHFRASQTCSAEKCSDLIFTASMNNIRFSAPRPKIHSLRFQPQKCLSCEHFFFFVRPPLFVGALCGVRIHCFSDVGATASSHAKPRVALNSRVIISSPLKAWRSFRQIGTPIIAQPRWHFPTS